jgi:copper resistance protein D
MIGHTRESPQDWSLVRNLSLFLRWLHVLAAITWIGGMLFLALVLVPVTRRIEDRALQARLFHAVGVRFRTLGWIALGILVATGLGNLWLYPQLLTTPRFQWKLGLVLLALGLSAFHDFVLGPRAGAPGVDPSVRVRASWLARVNVLVVLVVVLLGLSLLR